MAADWYLAWAADHCHKFGIRDADAKLVLAWREVFELLGFTAAELAAATLHLLASADAPRFAADHRAAVIRAVEAVRRRSTPASTSSSPSGCDLCGGCGIFTVPHPGLEDGGRRWREVLLTPDADPGGLARDAGVCCGCEAGRRTREATEASGRPLTTLAQYEHRYPYWREVQFAREQVLAAGRQQPSRADVERLNGLLADARRRAA